MHAMHVCIQMSVHVARASFFFAYECMHGNVRSHVPQSIYTESGIVMHAWLAMR